MKLLAGFLIMVPRNHNALERGVMSETTTKKTSGLAIAGLVLGILAAVTSFLPIINNLSAIIAVIGGVLAAISLVGALRGKHSSKGLAIAGVVLAVVSFAVVLATQSMYKSIIDTAAQSAKENSSAVVQTQAKDSEPTEDKSKKKSDEATAEEQTAPEATQEEAKEEAVEQDYSNLAVGTSVELKDGTKITVNSVQTGLVNYDDSLVACVNVTYENNGDKGASFNPYDWKGEDANGAQRSQSYYSDAENELNSGTLSPGGSVTGNIYFDDGIVRVLYYSNMFNDDPTAGWKL